MSRQLLVLRPCTWVYLLMILLTLLTWSVAAAGLGGISLSLCVLALALLKGQLIGDYYMGLKWVNSAWRWLVIGWLCIPGALISWAFFLGDQ
jgi:cytochrome c oxidase subunit 4